MNFFVGEQIGVPCSLIRAGSSKGVFFKRSELDFAGTAMDRYLMRMMGSPDSRQIDGIGGGDKLTSKVAIISNSKRTDCDVDYEFGQVGTAHSTIDWGSNCGNMAAGAAIFTVLHRMADVDYSATAVQLAINQLNMGRRILAHVPLRDGSAAVTGSYLIGGVPTAGAEISLDFSDFSGCTLGRGLFPTGSKVETLALDGLAVDMTVIDMSNLHVLVDGEALLGTQPSDMCDYVMTSAGIKMRLDAVRAAVSEQLGLTDSSKIEEFLLRSVNPLVYVIFRPFAYQTISDESVAADRYDLMSISYSRSAFSKAHPASGAIGVAIASAISGTLAHRLARQSSVLISTDHAPIRLGHPGGTLEVDVGLVETKNDIAVRRAIIGRTARLLMDGLVYVPRDFLGD